jgi:hypothetical protein
MVAAGLGCYGDMLGEGVFELKGVRAVVTVVCAQ